MTVNVASFHLLPEITGGTFKLITGLYNVLVLACDTIATISLCLILRFSRSEFKSTNEILDSLVRNFLGRGVFLVTIQGVHVILWFTEVSTLNWNPFFLISGKLYVATLVALLNLRLRNRTGNRSGSKSVTFNHLIWSRFGKRRRQINTLPERVHIQSHESTLSDIVFA